MPKSLPELSAATWNLHGKHFGAIKNVIDRADDPWDFLFLQELGGFSHLAAGEFTTDQVELSGHACTLVAHQAPLSHHAVGILIREQLELQIRLKTSFGVGFVLECAAFGRKIFLATGHFPHQQRRDATETWFASVAQLDEILMQARYCDCILLGMDCNQNLTLPNSSFAGLSRLLFLCRHRGLEFNPFLGNTWEARGEFSSIDWVFSRWPGVETSFHLRPDLRDALPSDHIPVVGILYWRTSLAERPPRPRHLCGRWNTSLDALAVAARDPTFIFSQETFAHVCTSSSVRVPSRKYRDPPEVLELIRLRKVSTNSETRASIMCDIHAMRVKAQHQHKLSLLQNARSGDRSAIAHLRRSASQTFSEGSFIE